MTSGGVPPVVPPGAPQGGGAPGDSSRKPGPASETAGAALLPASPPDSAPAPALLPTVAEPNVSSARVSTAVATADDASGTQEDAAPAGGAASVMVSRRWNDIPKEVLSGGPLPWVPGAREPARLFLSLDGVEQPGAVEFPVKMVCGSTGERRLKGSGLSALIAGRVQKGWRWRQAAPPPGLEVLLLLQSKLARTGGPTAGADGDGTAAAVAGAEIKSHRNTSHLPLTATTTVSGTLHEPQAASSAGALLPCASALPGDPDDQHQPDPATPSLSRAAPPSGGEASARPLLPDAASLAMAPQGALCIGVHVKEEAPDAGPSQRQRQQQRQQQQQEQQQWQRQQEQEQQHQQYQLQWQQQLQRQQRQLQRQQQRQQQQQQQRLAGEEAATPGAAAERPPWSHLMGTLAAHPSRPLRPLTSSRKAFGLGAMFRLQHVVGASRTCLATVVVDGVRQGPPVVARLSVNKHGNVHVRCTEVARTAVGSARLGWRWRRGATAAGGRLEVEIVRQGVPCPDVCAGTGSAPASASADAATAAAVAAAPMVAVPAAAVAAAVTDWSELLGQTQGTSKPLQGASLSYLSPLAGLEALLGPATVTLTLDGAPLGAAPLGVNLRAGQRGLLTFGRRAVCNLARGHMKRGWRWRRVPGGGVEVKLELQRTPGGSGAVGDLPPHDSANHGVGGDGSSGGEGAEGEERQLSETWVGSGRAAGATAMQATAAACSAGGTPSGAEGALHAAAGAAGWSDLLGQNRRNFLRRPLSSRDRVCLGPAFIAGDLPRALPCAVRFTVDADGAPLGSPVAAVLTTHHGTAMTVNSSAVARLVQGWLRKGWRWRHDGVGELEVRLYVQAAPVYDCGTNAEATEEGGAAAGDDAQPGNWSRLDGGDAGPVPAGKAGGTARGTAAGTGGDLDLVETAPRVAFGGAGALSAAADGGWVEVAAQGSKKPLACPTSVYLGNAHSTVPDPTSSARVFITLDGDRIGSGHLTASLHCRVGRGGECSLNSSKAAELTLGRWRQGWRWRHVAGDGLEVEVSLRSTPPRPLGGVLEEPLLGGGAIGRAPGNGAMDLKPLFAGAGDSHAGGASDWSALLGQPTSSTWVGLQLYLASSKSLLGVTASVDTRVHCTVNGVPVPGAVAAQCRCRASGKVLLAGELHGLVQDRLRQGWRWRHDADGVLEIMLVLQEGKPLGSGVRSAEVLHGEEQSVGEGGPSAVLGPGADDGPGQRPGAVATTSAAAQPTGGHPRLPAMLHLTSAKRSRSESDVSDGLSPSYARQVKGMVQAPEALGSRASTSGAAPAAVMAAAVSTYMPYHGTAAAGGGSSVAAVPVTGSAPDSLTSAPPPQQCQALQSFTTAAPLVKAEPVTAATLAAAPASVIQAAEPAPPPTPTTAAAARLVPAARVEEHMAMWGDIVSLLERSPAGLMADFDQAFACFWTRPCSVRRDMLAEQWRPQFAFLGRGNVQRALTLLHALMPALSLTPPSGGGSGGGAQQGAAHSLAVHAEDDLHVNVAQAVASQQAAAALLSSVPTELRVPKHSAMWEEVVYVLLGGGLATGRQQAAGQQVGQQVGQQAAGQQVGQLDWAAQVFWRQLSGGQRDVVEGQWRPVCDSLGRADMGALHHVLQLIVPGLVL